MTRIKIAIALTFIITFLANSNDVQALFRRRLRPPSTSAPRAAQGTGVVVKPRLRSDRLALILSVSNLQLAQSVNYILTYESNRKVEGLRGTIRPEEGNRTTRELLFGTCSTSVCTYHSNITNMRLVVTVKLKSGTTIIRPYRIRP